MFACLLDVSNRRMDLHEIKNCNSFEFYTMYWWIFLFQKELCPLNVWTHNFQSQSRHNYALCSTIDCIYLKMPLCPMSTSIIWYCSLISMFKQVQSLDASWNEGLKLPDNFKILESLTILNLESSGLENIPTSPSNR